MSNSTKQKHVLKINQTKEYEELAIDHTESMYAHISKFRTAVINSVLTVSFLMQEVVSEAVRSRM